MSKTGGSADSCSGGCVRNVKDFGAKGDGVTDDTAAIRACRAACGAVVFPAGTYRLTETLDMSGKTGGWWAGLGSALGYCLTHRKQLASAVAFGAGLLEAVQKAH